MNAQELADKFTAKIAVAAVEKDRQTEIAADNVRKRTADVEHCKRAMEQNVLPFLAELKHHLGEHQFSFAPQIELNDHRPVGVSFKIGNGAPTTITTAFGNIIVTRIGDSGTSKGVPFVYAPDVEPYIYLELRRSHPRQDRKACGNGDRYGRKLNHSRHGHPSRRDQCDHGN